MLASHNTGGFDATSTPEGFDLGEHVLPASLHGIELAEDPAVPV